MRTNASPRAPAHVDKCENEAVVHCFVIPKSSIAVDHQYILLCNVNLFEGKYRKLEGASSFVKSARQFLLFHYLAIWIRLQVTFTTKVIFALLSKFWKISKSIKYTNTNIHIHEWQITNMILFQHTSLYILYRYGSIVLGIYIFLSNYIFATYLL